MSGGLCLEDCLEDSPQTRALIGVYEQDGMVMLDFIQSLRSNYQKVASIQNDLFLATTALSKQLKQFTNLSSSLNLGVGDLVGVVNKLAVKVDEIAMINKISHDELVEGLNGQSAKFGDEDFEEFYRLKTNFHSSDKLHEEAAARLARVPRKRNNEKSWKEATDQLYAARKAFHNTSMLYCSCLNSLQKKQEIGIVQPIVSLLKSQVGHSVMCGDHSKEWTSTADHLSTHLSNLNKEIEESRQVFLKSIDCLDAASTRAYIPDPPTSLDFPELPVNRSKTQISGYLFHRSRGAILSQWNRIYFFTQAGNLMQQLKGEFGGRLCLDLERCSITSVDVDDRKHVFQITSSNNKPVILQAESKHQLEEWISTLSNLAKQRSDEKATSSEQKKTVEQPPQVTTSVASSASKWSSDAAASGSSMLLRIKQAASSLVSSPDPPKSDQKLHADNLQSLMTAEDGIIFNLPKIGRLCPTTSNISSSQEDKEEEANSTKHDGGDSENFRSVHPAQFLGCKKIAKNRCDADDVIDEAIWQVMTSRALRKVMSTIEVRVAVGSDAVCLLNADDRSVLKVLEWSTVSRVQSHSENARLFGFLATESESDAIVCYAFESSTSGDDVCCSINTAKAIEASLKVDKDVEKIPAEGAV